MPDPGVTVLYDGACRFCRASAAAMAAWDRRRRLTILPFADPEARRLAAAVPEGSRFGSVHAARGGDVASADAAIARILGELPGGRVLRAARVQSLYGLVARHRGPIGRLLPDLRVTRRVP
jgi:predicted DCC family thiol-disulfide oxidoreductase YuxK